MAATQSMEGPLLSEVFAAFAGGNGAEMDGRGFVKCLRDARLLDASQMSAADADLVFLKCKSKGSRKIGFDDFCLCLAEVASRKAMEVEIVSRYVCDARGPDYESGSTCASVMSSRPSVGPERFFYDRTSYTGTHKKGGPTVVGGGVEDGDMIQSSSLVHRGRPLEDALHRKREDAGGLPMLLGKGPMQRSSSTKSTRSVMSKKAASESSEGRARSKSPRGPERFFYDRSTYTGTHRHGGPSFVGNGLPKEPGYGDLRDLVNRSHVQDDALHRKKSKEGGACDLNETGSTMAPGEVVVDHPSEGVAPAERETDAGEAMQLDITAPDVAAEATAPQPPEQRPQEEQPPQQEQPAEVQTHRTEQTQQAEPAPPQEEHPAIGAQPPVEETQQVQPVKVRVQPPGATLQRSHSGRFVSGARLLAPSGGSSPILVRPAVPHLRAASASPPRFAPAHRGSMARAPPTAVRVLPPSQPQAPRTVFRAVAGQPQPPYVAMAPRVHSRVQPAAPPPRWAYRTVA